MNIKTFLITMITICFLSVSLAHAGSTNEKVEDFLRYLINQAESFANDKTLSEEERDHKYLHLFRETFDVPKIGRFVLGRYWRKATMEQKEEFLETFELVIVRTFGPMITKFPISNFSVKEIRRIKSQPNISLVYTIIRRINDTPIHIIWQVDEKTGRYKILDIKAEGISLLVTLRSEYSSYISQEGGIDGLIVILLGRLEK